jgi:ADP-heptose:LPS heptosyltransferase
LKRRSYGSILVYASGSVDSAMGENVFKLPMLIALAENFPEARISWVPGIGTRFFLQDQLAPLVDGRIHEFITDLDIPIPFRQALFMRHPILKRRFDLIIDTQRHVSRTLFLRRIPHGRFISDNWRYMLSDRWPPKGVPRRPSLLYEKLLGLASTAAGHRVEVANPLSVPEPWRRRAAAMLPAGPVYVGLAPGVGNKTHGRDWPFDRFMAVARAQVEQGRVPVVFLGPGELDMADAVRAAVPEAMIPDLGGEHGGPALTVALSGHLHAALANDAGAGHLLAGGGAPMVSLFGWSRPEKRAPFSRSLIVLRSRDYGSTDIADIPVEPVIQALETQVTVGPVQR